MLDGEIGYGKKKKKKSKHLLRGGGGAGGRSLALLDNRNTEDQSN